MSPNLHLHQVKSNDNNHDKNKDNSIEKNILIKNEEKKKVFKHYLMILFQSQKK